MAAVGPVSIDMYLPGFPAIEREFGVRGVETTMAAYLVGLAVSQLFYGPISDRFGRKPPLYFGFALYALGAAGWLRHAVGGAQGPAVRLRRACRHSRCCASCKRLEGPRVSSSDEPSCAIVASRTKQRERSRC